MSNKDVNTVFLENICNQIGGLLNSISPEDVKRIHPDTNMTLKEAQVNIVFGIIGHVISNIIMHIPKPSGYSKREDKRKFYSFLLKEFTDKAWEYINESDKEVH